MATGFLTVQLCNQTSRFPINMLQFMVNFECSQKMVTDTQLVIPHLLAIITAFGRLELEAGG